MSASNSSNNSDSVIDITIKYERKRQKYLKYVTTVKTTRTIFNNIMTNPSSIAEALGGVSEELKKQWADGNLYKTLKKHVYDKGVERLKNPVEVADLVRDPKAYLTQFFADVQNDILASGRETVADVTEAARQRLMSVSKTLVEEGVMSADNVGAAMKKNFKEIFDEPITPENVADFPVDLDAQFEDAFRAADMYGGNDAVLDMMLTPMEADHALPNDMGKGGLSFEDEVTLTNETDEAFRRDLIKKTQELFPEDTELHKMAADIARMDAEYATTLDNAMAGVSAAERETIDKAGYKAYWKAYFEASDKKGKSVSAAMQEAAEAFRNATPQGMANAAKDKIIGAFEERARNVLNQTKHMYDFKIANGKSIPTAVMESAAFAARLSKEGARQFFSREVGVIIRDVGVTAGRLAIEGVIGAAASVVSDPLIIIPLGYELLMGMLPPEYRRNFYWWNTDSWRAVDAPQFTREFSRWYETLPGLFTGCTIWGFLGGVENGTLMKKAFEDYKACQAKLEKDFRSEEDETFRHIKSYWTERCGKLNKKVYSKPGFGYTCVDRDYDPTEGCGRGKIMQDGVCVDDERFYYDKCPDGKTLDPISLQCVDGTKAKCPPGHTPYWIFSQIEGVQSGRWICRPDDGRQETKESEVPIEDQKFGPSQPIDPNADPTVDPTVDPNADPTVDPNADPNADPTVDPITPPLPDPVIVDPTKPECTTRRLNFLSISPNLPNHHRMLLGADPDCTHYAY